MPISQQWSDDSKRCIHITYKGAWTWDELRAGAQDTNALLDSVNYDVILIQDTTEGPRLPTGNIIQQVRPVIAGFSDNLALIIVVTQSSLVRTFLSIIMGLIPAGRGNIIRTASTTEEALQLAQKTIAAAS